MTALKEKGVLVREGGGRADSGELYRDSLAADVSESSNISEHYCHVRAECVCATVRGGALIRR